MNAEATQPTLNQQSAPLAPRPTGVFVLVVLLALNGFLGVVASGLRALGSISGPDTAALLPSLAETALALFFAVLAIGMLRRRRWAQAAMLAYVALGVLLAVVLPFLGVGSFNPIGIFFDVAIAAYLTKPEVHAYFGTA